LPAWWGSALHPEPRSPCQTLPVARSQHFLLTHGTRDPLIPIDPVRAQVALLKSAGLDIEWHEFVKEHTIAGEQELEVIRRFIRRQLKRV